MLTLTALRMVVSNVALQAFGKPALCLGDEQVDGKTTFPIGEIVVVLGDWWNPRHSSS